MLISDVIFLINLYSLNDVLHICKITYKHIDLKKYLLITCNTPTGDPVCNNYQPSYSNIARLYVDIQTT